MAKFKAGDRVKITASPENWPPCTRFPLAGAEGTVGCWVDWPEAMGPYDEFVYLMVDRANGEGKQYEGINLIVHEDQLEKLGQP